jgi:hypothetical protein
LRYLTTGEVASRSQVSVGTVLVAFRTPGRHVRIRVSELRRFQAAFGFGAEADEQEFVDRAVDALRDLVHGARVEAPATGFGDDQAEQLAFVTQRAGLTAIGRRVKALLDADSAAPGVTIASSRARAKTERAHGVRRTKTRKRTRH